MKRIHSIAAGSLFALLLFAATGCEKLPCEDGRGYLRFDRATTNVADKQGSTRVFKVESDVSWELSVTPVTPATADWMVLNTYSGHGTKEIIITAASANTTGLHRIAEVKAVSTSHPSLPVARMSVVQYDSLFTIK